MGIFYTFVSGLKSPRVSLWAWGNKRPKTAAQKGLLASDDGDDSLTRAIQNAGQDTADIAGQRIIERNLNVQPTLKVRPGWRFNIIVSRDLILKPYGE